MEFVDGLHTIDLLEVVLNVFDRHTQWHGFQKDRATVFNFGGDLY
jgi:hypothetical protein